MQKALRFVFPIVILAAMGAAVAAENKTQPIQLNDKITVKATVEAIDHANRTVTLRGPKGNLETLMVDKSVDRFDNVKVGDQITLDYYESVVVDLHKPGEAPVPASTKEEFKRAEGSKPGGTSVIKETMTVTVESIDPSIPAVTVRTPEGDTLSSRVQNKKFLNNVKVGDQVVITRTEGLVVKVESPK